MSSKSGGLQICDSCSSLMENASKSVKGRNIAAIRWN